ncbi:MAG: response regulator, partial [Actinomycetota bacterium]|nr:response regulator [Actinomycetota bacterium]
NVVVIPVLFEDQVLAVIELASFRPFSEVNQTFLEQLTETIGVVLNTIIANTRTEELLQQSQSLAGELQSQSEELQTQQEELQQRNEELEEKATLLSEQNRDIEIKNREIEAARGELETKARQLAVSSKYKSEFLANMSHELRTPLNSLLILAKLLSDNPDSNLSEKQIDFARTIHSSGSDLLSLIDDILDLSKIEAGKMDVNASQLEVGRICSYVTRAFGAVAEQKGLSFHTQVDEGAPDLLVTDEQRLQQILKNLISNAIKFTSEGSVTLRVGLADESKSFETGSLKRAGRVLRFAVEDTGIGISAEKFQLIFEPFQQADGTTSRKYGGTGLGLSISREIARLLGGEIHAESTEGRGSVFSLYLPLAYEPVPDVPPEPDLTSSFDPSVVGVAGGSAASGVTADALMAPDASLLMMGEVEDDRDEIQPTDRMFLIVQGDPDAARAALEAARVGGFKGVVASRGDQAIALTRELQPDAVLLDMHLAANDAWNTLDHLKHHSETRHIPVYVVADDDHRQRALRSGAIGFVERPVDEGALEPLISAAADFLGRPRKSLLVVDDDATQRNSIAELVAGDDVEIRGVGSAEEAIAELEKGPYDCMVLDLKLPKMSGFKLLERVKKDERFAGLPIIIYTGKDLTRGEETKLKKFAETIIVKDVNSPERLLDETSLFLHRPEATLPAEQRKMLEQLHKKDAAFVGKKILVVDDDVRNVFALASVLENNGMEVQFAENGRDGIETLQRNPDVDLVLMDIMMPEMDGYETMRAIRKLKRFEKLPIIALTAKAMKGDREKSIASGASDYITKPVDTDQLLSLMRVWLYS